MWIWANSGFHYISGEMKAIEWSMGGGKKGKKKIKFDRIKGTMPGPNACHTFPFWEHL